MRDYVILSLNLWKKAFCVSGMYFHRPVISINLNEIPENKHKYLLHESRISAISHISLPALYNEW